MTGIGLNCSAVFKKEMPVLCQKEDSCLKNIILPKKDAGKGKKNRQ